MCNLSRVVLSAVESGLCHRQVATGLCVRYENGTCWQLQLVSVATSPPCAAHVPSASHLGASTGAFVQRPGDVTSEGC